MNDSGAHPTFLAVIDFNADLAQEGRGTTEAAGRHCQVNESGTYEGRLIRDQAAVTAVHTVNARARNIRC